jgi:hypothetical protein
MLRSQVIEEDQKQYDNVLTHVCNGLNERIIV